MRLTRLRSFCAIATVLLIGSLRVGWAQVEREIGFQPRVWAIINARLVVSPDKELAKGSLVIRDGLIAAVGENVPVPPEATIIDGAGLTVYPGFLDAGNSANLVAPVTPFNAEGRPHDLAKYALAATAPDQHRRLTPEYRAKEQLRFDNAMLESRRKSGFTAVHAIPHGRIASGWSALHSTSGAPLRESLLGGDLYPEFEFFAANDHHYPATRMGAVAHLRQTFLDARRIVQQRDLYNRNVTGIPRPAEDPVLFALGDIAARKPTALFDASDRDAIGRALDFSKEQELPTLVWGGHEAYRLIPRLVETRTGVLLRVDWGEEPKLEPTPPTGEKSPDDPPTVVEPLRVRQRRIEQWRERVRGLSQLQAQGVRVALSSEGLKDSSELLKAVRLMVREGTPLKGVLAALTRDAAILLGQERRLGTLETGKLAHLTVWTGPVDHELSRVRHVFVDGQKYDYNLDAKPVPAASDAKHLALAGTWQVTISAADAPVAATLEINQSANSLAGLFRSPQGEGRLTSGTTTGRKFEFVVGIGAGAQSLELKFSGESDRDAPTKISGTLKSPFGAAAKWTAVRNAPQTVPPNSADASKTLPAKNPVHIRLDTGDDPEESAATARNVPSQPASALARQAKSAGSASETGSEQPTELDVDRRMRPLQTGGNVLIKGGTVLTGVGPARPNTSVLIKNGNIAAIGPDLKAETGMTVIDATGQFVMPGIIDTHAHIMFADGLNGVNEATFSIVPEVRVADVLRTEDVDAFRGLAGGVTTARLLHGSANVVGGQHAVVKLKFGEPAGAQWLASAPGGVKFALGENVKMPQHRFPKTRLGVEATIQRAFFEALDYRSQWMRYQAELNKDPKSAATRLPPRRDLRLEALTQILEQQSFIHCHSYRADEILMLLRVASSLGIRVKSLQHVLEGYKVAPEIAAHGASCSTFADWWAYKMEAYDAIPWNAAMLESAGANVVLKSDFPEPMRHLYIDAAKMPRYGNLSPEAALRMITLNGARELGIDQRTGSLEVGKDADIAIFNGHPLNAFSRCEITLIDGEVFFMRSKLPTAMSSFKPSSKSRDLVVAAPAVRDQQLALPALGQADRSTRFALVHATIHPVSAPEFLDGTLLIEGDRIAALGQNVTIPAGTTTIDLKGLHIYPGLIDAGSALGVSEIGKVRETNDTTEGGLFQPDIRTGIAVNPDSELIPVARAGGITTTLVLPQGGVIAGQCSLVQLGGWTVPDMVLNYDLGLMLNWPAGKEGVPRVRQLREYLQEGRAYLLQKQAAAKGATPAGIVDPRFEALAPYLRGEKKVFIEADSRQSILAALQFADREKLKVVLVGAVDGWKVAAEIKKRDVPVIVGPIMRAPLEAYDPADAPYANAGRLHEAGVLVCFRSDNASNSRNTPFDAALAVAHGLPEEEGLKAVTWNTARILGVDSRLGSLAVGKRADLVLTDGSPLQPSTMIKGTFIAGKPYSTESKQSRLYERYKLRMREVQSQKKQ